MKADSLPKFTSDSTIFLRYLALYQVPCDMCDFFGFLKIKLLNKLPSEGLKIGSFRVSFHAPGCSYIKIKKNWCKCRHFFSEFWRLGIFSFNLLSFPPTFLVLFNSQLQKRPPTQDRRSGRRYCEICPPGTYIDDGHCERCKALQSNVEVKNDIHLCFVY